MTGQTNGTDNKAEQRWQAGGMTTGPVADRDRAWDAGEADSRVREWAGGEDAMKWSQYAKAFLLHDAGNPEEFGSYKLPYCDVIDGELIIVPRGVFALAGGRGVNKVADIDDDLRDALRSRVTALYQYIAKQLDADDIVSPFEDEVSKGAALDAIVKTPLPRAGHTPSFKQAPSYDELIGDRTVVGFPSIFGNVDDGGDVVVAGAFKKTLEERGHRLRWLWGHDAFSPPIATILEVEQVGRRQLPEGVQTQYPEATGGLRVKRRYLETLRGNEVLTGIAAGAITEMSFGYDPIKVEFPEEPKELGGRRPQRILKEVRLWEFSDVMWGMNPATANVKSLGEMNDDELLEWLQANGKLDAVLRKQASAADEVKQAALAAALAYEQRRRRLEIQRRRVAVP